LSDPATGLFVRFHGEHFADRIGSQRYRLIAAA
jgi:nitrate/nitrite transporter NarK